MWVTIWISRRKSQSEPLTVTTTLQLLIQRTGIHWANLMVNSVFKETLYPTCLRGLGEWLHLTVTRAENGLVILCNGKKIMAQTVDGSGQLDDGVHFWFENKFVGLYDVLHGPPGKS